MVGSVAARASCPGQANAAAASVSAVFIVISTSFRWTVTAILARTRRAPQVTFLSPGIEVAVGAALELVLAEQRLQVGERLVGGGLRARAAARGIAMLPVDQARVLVVVAVHAQELPVAAVLGVVVVVV